jgi:hypothetical protein
VITATKVSARRQRGRFVRVVLDGETRVGDAGGIGEGKVALVHEALGWRYGNLSVRWDAMIFQCVAAQLFFHRVLVMKPRICCQMMLVVEDSGGADVTQARNRSPSGGSLTAGFLGRPVEAVCIKRHWEISGPAFSRSMSDCIHVVGLHGVVSANPATN